MQVAIPETPADRAAINRMSTVGFWPYFDCHGGGCVRRLVSDTLSKVEIRQAEENDIADICSFDHLAHERKAFIQTSVRSGAAYVAVSDGRITGYMVLEYSFFGEGFIGLLYINPDYRRKGIGSALVGHAESICRTEKLFTSTNESNVPMQALMAKLGYVPSGIINNLDEGDPEIVYFRKLEKSR